MNWNEFIQQIPDFLWGVLAIVIIYKPAVILISEGVTWWGQFCARRQVELAAKGAGHMDVDHTAPKRAVFPVQLTVFDALENIARAVFYSFNGIRYIAEERTRVESQGEAQFLQAFFEAGRARGIRYLPAKVVPHIQLHLTEGFLRASGVDPDALGHLENRRRQLGRNSLCDSLFSASTLNVVDLTPQEQTSPNYFVKYFQPLMVAFESRRFRESCGSLEVEHRVLLEHLRLLTQRRLRAGYVIPAEVELLETELAKSLPRAVSTGIGQKSARDKQIKFNQKESARAALFLAVPSEGDAIEQVLFAVDQQLRAARFSFTKRTSSPGAPGEPFCALYQAEAA